MLALGLEKALDDRVRYLLVVCRGCSEREPGERDHLLRALPLSFLAPTQHTRVQDNGAAGREHSLVSASS